MELDVRRLRNVTQEQEGAKLQHGPEPSFGSTGVRPYKGFVERLSLKSQAPDTDLLTTGTTRVPMIPFDDDADDVHEVPDIPGLGEYPFNCVRSCLRRERLQFHMEDLNCFGVQLAKFFAENALALEEMHIEVPDYELCEYINRKVRRWMSDSSKRRNSPSRTGFTHA
ncbi:hypothetical protein C2845_PM18G11120 [Panicum miliaceum]|uniref:FBD domain-containing protein n=1 Tax=Panicum miliaceum TaxID=4540 RepID=A0A3L6PK42_PANMI|nr:hypothetical protein C2845_PM18G11120 [Panicum miliaceum]